MRVFKTLVETLPLLTAQLIHLVVLRHSIFLDHHERLAPLVQPVDMDFIGIFTGNHLKIDVHYTLKILKHLCLHMPSLVVTGKARRTSVI